MQTDLEENTTIYRHDYKIPAVQKQNSNWKKASYPEFEKPKPRPVFSEDHETFQRRPYNQHIPFDLLWKPKAITQIFPQCITTKVCHNLC